MRVAYVTTWGSQCGVATYTEELITALLKAGRVQPLVFAPAEAGSLIRTGTPDVPTKMCWTRNDLQLAERFLSILETPPGIDLMHIEHEDGLFWQPQALFRAISTVRERGIKVVVTMHTVRPYGSWQYSGFLDGLCDLADGVIVHTPEALASIACANGSHAKLRLIPHGCDTTARVGDRLKGLQLLGVPQAFWEKATVGLSFGFLGPNKNLIATVRGVAAAIARRLCPRVFFVISGSSGEQQQQYMGTVRITVRETGYWQRFVIHDSFTATADIPDVMAAAHFGVLNTTATVLSASGAANVFLRHGVPLAVANRPIYSDAIRAGAVPFEVDSTAENPSPSLIYTIGALARDESMRRQVAATQAGSLAQISWDRVAALHQAFYQELLG